MTQQPGPFGYRGIPGGGYRGAASQGPSATPQPGSGAFHGDELPPAEGTAATREWITNPALGLPTLSTKNIEATKAAIQRYERSWRGAAGRRCPPTPCGRDRSGQEVVILHRRLEISGDLVGKSIPDEYDAALRARR